MIEDDVVIVPANEATWDDVMTVFGTSDPARCLCQRFRIGHWEWTSPGREERAAELRAQTACDDPGGPSTSGLVAYLDGEPVGWCAVAPRSDHAGLPRGTWSGRNEDPQDPAVWAVSCFVTRVGYRKRGLTYALAKAAVDFARERGAKALEGYAMITEPGKEITWGELHVGALSVFEEAGLRPVSRPSKRRVVLRIDF